VQAGKTAEVVSEFIIKKTDPRTLKFIILPSFVETQKYISDESKGPWV